MDGKLVEKHRPNSLDEMIGQQKIVNATRSLIKRKRKFNLFLIGLNGTGKTSLAIVIAKEMFGDDWVESLHMFNTSKERGIDWVRGDIARTSRFQGPRLLVLDEIDNMTDAAQNALRGLMEEENDCIWILTGNKDHKVIPPIRGRCTTFRFGPLSDLDIGRRLIQICKIEGINIDDDAKDGLKALIRACKGSLRTAINNLELIINEHGEITAESVEMLQYDSQMPKILQTAIDGDWQSAKSALQKQWILSTFSYDTLVNDIFDALDEQDGLSDPQKIRAFEILAEMEGRLKIGCDPLTQLVGFISTIWVIRHVPQPHR